MDHLLGHEKTSPSAWLSISNNISNDMEWWVGSRGGDGGNGLGVGGNGLRGLREGEGSGWGMRMGDGGNRLGGRALCSVRARMMN